MKPHIAIAFFPNVPVETLIKHNGSVIQTPDGPVRAMSCTEVRETSYGFLELVPVQEEGMPLPLRWYVPVGYVMWMAQAEKFSPLGFLSTQA